MKIATRRHTVIPAKAGIQSPASVDNRLRQGVGEAPFFIPLCGLRKAMVILNEAKRSEESKIADCKTTSSVGRNPRFLATLGMTRRRGVGLIIATILFTYPC